MQTSGYAGSQLPRLAGTAVNVARGVYVRVEVENAGAMPRTAGWVRVGDFAIGGVGVLVGSCVDVGVREGGIRVNAWESAVWLKRVPLSVGVRVAVLAGRRSSALGKQAHSTKATKTNPTNLAKFD